MSHYRYLVFLICFTVAAANEKGEITSVSNPGGYINYRVKYKDLSLVPLRLQQFVFTAMLDNSNKGCILNAALNLNITLIENEKDRDFMNLQLTNRNIVGYFEVD